MAYVVIRRFRTGEGPTTARAFAREGEAKTAADLWCHEGWEVEIVPTGGRGTKKTLKLPDLYERPHRPHLPRVE